MFLIMDSIVIPPLRQKKYYPQTTAYACPECKAPVELDKVTVTEANYDGEPVEHDVLGFYCTNDHCEHHIQPLNEEDLDDYDDDPSL